MQAEVNVSTDTIGGSTSTTRWWQRTREESGRTVLGESGKVRFPVILGPSA